MGEQIPHLQTEKYFRPGTRPGRKWIAFDLPPAGGKLCEAFLTGWAVDGRGDILYNVSKLFF
jgi:hypothetical protein